MSNGIGRSIFQKFNGGFGLPFMPEKNKIKGILTEKDGKSIKIDIGGNRRMELQLRREIEGKTGELVVIDKKDVVNSSLEKQASTPLKQEEAGLYSKILQSFNMPIKDELLGALKILDIHGIQLSKENLLSLMMSQNQLTSVIDGLDYDTAIGLMDKAVDIERDPLQKVAASVEELKEGNKGSSIIKYLRSQFKMSADEAERIAAELYGSKMGKDYTDIIKALDKAGIEISKKNVDRLHEIFSKLQKLKNVGDELLISSIKNKVEATIDNLVKLKDAVTKGIVAADERLGGYVASLYEANTYKADKVTEKELLLLEEDIKELLAKEGYRASDENIRLAKELIKAKLPVAAESLEKVSAIKQALKELISVLDSEKAALLLKENVSIEREAITALLDKIKGLEKAEAGGSLSGDMPRGLKEEISSILTKLSNLKAIKDEDLVALLRRGIDFKLSDLERLTASNVRISDNLAATEPKLAAAYQAAVSTAEALQQVKSISFNTIAFHLNHKMELTLQQIAQSNRTASNESHSLVKEAEAKPHGQNNEIIRALINHKMPVNQLFIDKLQNIKKQLAFLQEGITSNIAVKAVEEQVSLMKLELGKAVDYVKGFAEADKLGALKEAVPQLTSNKQHLLAMMMKNSIPLTLKGLKELSMLYNNRLNLTQGINELSELLRKNGMEGLSDDVAKLPASIKSLAAGLKGGKNDANSFYEELFNTLELISSNSGSLDKESRLALDNKMDKIREVIELQQQMNKNDTSFQIPVILNEELKNLQIYVMNKKKNTKKIDPQNMSILLNMETSSVGNLCIYAAVAHKSIVLKIGTENSEYRKAIEPQAKVLVNLMKDIGYEVKELGFRVNEEQSMLDILNHTEHEETVMKHYFDMRI